MRIILNGQEIIFLQPPRITSSTSGGQMSFTTDEVNIPKYASVIVYNSNDNRMFTGIVKSYSTNALKTPRTITVNCVDYSWLLQGKLLTGIYAGKAQDIVNQLIINAGLEEIFGYLTIPYIPKVNIDLGDSGVYLQEALSKVCTSIGIYFGVSTTSGELKFYTLENSSSTQISLPISNCNLENNPKNISYSLTYPETNRVIVKGKGGVLSDFSLPNRNESIFYEIGISDPQRHYGFLPEATKVVRAEVTEKAITPGFSIELIPEEIFVKSGTRDQAVYTVQSTSIEGFTGTISLSASFYPLEAGMEVILGSTTLSVGNTTTLTAKLKDEFPAITWGGGQEEITIIGTIGSTSPFRYFFTKNYFLIKEEVMSNETLLNQITERFRSLSLEFNGLRSDNDALISHVNQLRKVISDGNGQPSLVERTAILNTRISQLEDQFKILEQQKDQQGKDKRAFWIALLGGLTGIVSTIVQFFFSK